MNYDTGIQPIIGKKTREKEKMPRGICLNSVKTFSGIAKLCP